MRLQQRLSKNLREIKRLITITEEKRTEFITIFINGDPQYTQANSGYLDQNEASQIRYALEFISQENYFIFYNNASTFVGDIILNKIQLSSNPYKLLYSTAQIGIDVNRRSFIPNFSQINNIFSLTGDGHQLSLLQNKMHYYEISKNYVNVPKTFLFNGKNYFIFEEINKSNIDKYVIKPNIECSGRGVKLIKNLSSLKTQVENLYENFRQPILIQEFKKGKEIEIPVVITDGNPIALPAIEIIKDDILIDQDISDLEKYGFNIFESEPSIEAMKQAERLAVALQLQGLCRIDFIVDDIGIPWLFDIAAIPLISQHSSCYTAFKSLFPEDPFALYKTLIGCKLADLIGPINDIRDEP